VPSRSRSSASYAHSTNPVGPPSDAVRAFLVATMRPSDRASATRT
jgi:hypothetical protein